MKNLKPHHLIIITSLPQICKSDDMTQFMTLFQGLKWHTIFDRLPLNTLLYRLWLRLKVKNLQRDTILVVFWRKLCSIDVSNCKTLTWQAHQLWLYLAPVYTQLNGVTVLKTWLCFCVAKTLTRWLISMAMLLHSDGKVVVLGITWCIVVLNNWRGTTDGIQEQVSKAW